MNQGAEQLSKPHYHILDGLRGVAALMVMWYHIFEGFATSPIDQKFNHGYLAVDFFFVLSGFVVGYAYDDRWGKMSKSEFFKRRIIRLHPMLILGVVLGVVSFIVQGCEQWDGTSVALSAVAVSFLMSVFLIPSVPGAFTEVRGNGELFPLNGPAWSLFFEYIGNILYAIILRRLNTKALATVVGVTAIGYAWYAISNMSGYGNMGVGWSLADNNLLGGMLRLTFSFSAGLLMARVFAPRHIKGAFWWCSAVVIILLSMPYAGTPEMMWTNGIYDSVCAIVVFPMLVYMGACGTLTGNVSVKICDFLGKISYPLYIVHYPFMYLFYSWVWKNGYTFGEVWPVAVLVYAASLLVAYLALKFYDTPLRNYLTAKFLRRR